MARDVTKETHTGKSHSSEKGTHITIYNCKPLLAKLEVFFKNCYHYATTVLRHYASHIILSPLEGKDIFIWLNFFFLHNILVEHKLTSNHFIYVPNTVKQSYLNMWMKAFKF